MSFDKVKNHLKKFNLEDRIVILDESTATVDLAAKAIGVSSGEIAKSLSFLVDEIPIVIVTSGDAKISNSKFKKTFHKRAPMINREDVEFYIGHAAGGVCPFGVNENVKIYLDNSLKKYEIVYPAGGTSNSLVKLSLEELEKCIDLESWVDVTNE